MELPQPQLAFDPCMAKFHDSSTTAVLRLCFFAGHFPAKRDHHRAFFGARYRTAAFLIVWTTLRLANAALAILRLGFVAVVNQPWPWLAAPLWMQNFALRANIAILFRLIEEGARWQPARQAGSTRHIFPSHASQKIDLSPGQLLDVVPCGVAAIGHHLSRFFLQPLFHAIHRRQ